MAGIPLNRNHIEAALTFEPAARHDADLTGAPTAPTPDPSENSTRLATTAFVQAVIAALIDAAPGALNTLNELADALGNDPNFATTVTNLLATKAPLLSPALTGVPTAPTAAAGTNTTQISTTAFVRAAISALIDAAPGGLDTLNKLAIAIGNDPNFSATISAALATKAPLLSPILAGTPTAPTAAAGTNTTQIATTAFVKTALEALIASAPGALDTLNELAAALGNDPNFAATVTTLLAGKAPLLSPALTGVPTAPTAPAGTNTGQIATTAFTKALLESYAPAKDGTGAFGLWPIGAQYSFPGLTLGGENLNDLVLKYSNFNGSGMTDAPTTGYYNINTTTHRGGLYISTAIAINILDRTDTKIGWASGAPGDYLTRAWEWATLWTSKNFDPATKANANNPVLTGTAQIENFRAGGPPIVVPTGPSIKADFSEWSTINDVVVGTLHESGGLPKTCYPGGGTAGNFNGTAHTLDIPAGVNRVQGEVILHSASTALVRNGSEAQNTVARFNASMMSANGRPTPIGQPSRAIQVWTTNNIWTNRNNLRNVGYGFTEFFGLMHEDDTEVHPIDALGTQPEGSYRNTLFIGGSTCQPKSEFAVFQFDKPGVWPTAQFPRGVPWKKIMQSANYAAETFAYVGRGANPNVETGEVGSQPFYFEAFNGVNSRIAKFELDPFATIVWGSPAGFDIRNGDLGYSRFAVTETHVMVSPRHETGDSGSRKLTLAGRYGGVEQFSTIEADPGGSLVIHHPMGGGITLADDGLLAKVSVSAAGVAFNGAAPTGRYLISGDLPTDGSASNAAIAAAINNHRNLLLNCGLARAA
jgi:hypothetical protein